MTNENFVYFPSYVKEWRQICSVATPEQVYQLVLMCLDYVENIEVPVPEDPVIKLCFTMASGSIDRGIEKSYRKSKQSRYNRYCGICKNKGIDILPFTEWDEQIDSKKHSDERQRPSTDVNKRERSSTEVTNVNNHNHNHNLNHNHINHNLNSLNQSIKAPEAPSSSENRSKQEPYNPQLWECEIPKMFWGKFQYEDDYYAYAEEHRDEIIKMLDEMENQKEQEQDQEKKKGKRPA